MNILSTFRSQSGFTLVEMLTVLGIIAVLCGLLIITMQVGNRRQELRDTAAGYVTAAREAESLASSAQAIPDPDQDDQSISRKAYGVCITSSEIIDNPGCADPVAANKTADMYQVYARDPAETALNVRESVMQRPHQPEIINSFKLPKGLRFLAPAVWLDYLPPDPTLLADGRTEDVQVSVMYENATTADCEQKRDCQFIRVKPRAGAVYVD